MAITKQDLIDFLKRYHRLTSLRKSIDEETKEIEQIVKKYNVAPQKVDTSKSAIVGKFWSGYITFLILLTIILSVVVLVVSFIMLIIGDGEFPANFFTNMIRPVSLWVSKHIFLCEYAIFNLPVTSIIFAFLVSAVLSIPCGIPKEALI